MGFLSRLFGLNWFVSRSVIFFTALAIFIIGNGIIGVQALADNAGSALSPMRPHCHGRSDVPGSVKLCKTATEVPGLVNTWDVTLRVEAQELKRTSDVVLVIDRSGSMASQGRIEAAKKSAKLFVDKLLSDTSSQATRIGLVSFATNATLEKKFAETRMNYMLRSMRYQPMAEPSLKPQYVKRLKC